MAFHSRAHFLSTIKIVIVVLGGFGSGKSTLISAFKGKTNLQTDPTIGAIYAIQDVPVEFLTEQSSLLDPTTKIQLCIWDTTGSEKYSAILPGYVQKACAVIICFDRFNLVDLVRRIDLVRQETLAPIILAPTKMDQVLRENCLTEIKEFFRPASERLDASNDLGPESGLFPIIETSAYSGLGVREVFQTAASRGFAYMLTVSEKTSLVELTRIPLRADAQQKGGCC